MMFVLVTLASSAPASHQSGPEEKFPVVLGLRRRRRLSLQSLELSLVPPPGRSPDRSPGRSLVMSPSELPGKAGPGRRRQTVASEGPGTASLARGRQILSRGRSWSHCGPGHTGTTDISELLAGGFTHPQSDGLLTAARTPGLAGTTDISEGVTGGIALAGPGGLLAPGGTDGGRGGDGWWRDVHGETLPADVDVGVTRGVALT